MTSLTSSPSIDQGALQNFEDSFHELAQQTKSKLVASGAVKFLSSKGKTNNYGRIGRIELSEVNARNPDKVFGDYAIDNRQFTKRRFTKTIQIDALYDINELLKDPTSDILMQLHHAKERVTDSIAAAAALGDVLIGAPDVAPTTLTAAADGVITVDGSAGFTSTVVDQVTQNFINNDIPYADFKGSLISVTGSENSDLMADVKFTSSDYISGKPREANVIGSLGTYGVEMFAGSVSGGITVVNPVLAEGATLRDCIVMAPNSIVMSMELAKLDVQKSANKVNSYDITIDYWINAMRTEGALIQKIETTI